LNDLVTIRIALLLFATLTAQQQGFSTINSRKAHDARIFRRIAIPRHLGDTTMNTLTKLLLATVLVSGTASSVFANTQFDVDIYRPAIQDNALGAYARVPADALRSQPRTIRPFSPEEQRFFDRASSPQNS
jgi:hypothetical protein